MSAHQPRLASYLGPDELGNFRFAVESGSNPGTYHYALVRPDGGWAHCTCRACADRGHCSMTDGATELAKRGQAHAQATHALDVALGTLYNLGEHLEVDVGQLEAELAVVECFLRELGAA